MSDDWSRAIFREEAHELLAELETTLLELDQTPDDDDLVNRTFRALHTIKGSGAMFGFEEIADFTHEVESVFDRVRGGELRVTSQLINVAFKARDHIKNLLDDAFPGDDEKLASMEGVLHDLGVIASGGGEEPGEAAEAAPDLGEADSDTVEDLVVLGSEAPEADKETPAPAAEAVAQRPEPSLEQDGTANRYRIELRPRDGKSAADYSPEPLLEELAAMGAATVLEPPDAESGEGAKWVVELSTACSEEEVRDVFFFADIDLDVSVFLLDGDSLAAPVLEPDVEASVADDDAAEDAAGDEPDVAADVTADAVPDAVSEAERNVEHGVDASAEPTPKPAPAPIAKPEPTPETEPAPAPSPAPKPAPKPESAARKKPERPARAASSDKPASSDGGQGTSLRVAAAKLDKLVDLVVELVIVQAQISQLAAERGDQTLTVLSENLDRLSDELRDTTLGVRMLPIGTTFSKFRRLVRDLSADLGKEIDLVTIGAETELDKTVIERLGDPLVHLLRNSIDHGVEMPDVREAAGKSRRGTLRLSAEHSGGEVLIRIADDGAGMNLEAIKARALDRGLISPDAELADRDLCKLIFEPGFSTAKQVTNVSGRGVGMDVVKRAIDSLRGNIDVETTRGKGSVITIRLPLTLAIIDGLQVRSGDEFYVIPLTLVEECVELVDGGSQEDGGRRILERRGEIIPYISLREWFEVPGERPGIEQVVVTGVNGTRIGFVVDDVIGEHQTVIKTLGKVYRDVDGVSGATIKGDGTIALILDIPGLVRRVAAETA
jgi:two-component system chemotaxis sensor kinase CheA